MQKICIGYGMKILWYTQPLNAVLKFRLDSEMAVFHLISLYRLSSTFEDPSMYMRVEQGSLFCIIPVESSIRRISRCVPLQADT